MPKANISLDVLALSTRNSPTLPSLSFWGMTSVPPAGSILVLIQSAWSKGMMAPKTRNLENLA